MQVAGNNVSPSSTLLQNMEQERNALQQEMEKVQLERDDIKRSYEERLTSQYGVTQELEQRLQSAEQKLTRAGQENDLLVKEVEVAKEEAEEQSQELQTVRRNLTAEVNEKNEE